MINAYMSKRPRGINIVKNVNGRIIFINCIKFKPQGVPKYEWRSKELINQQKHCIY
jgi:hypothetical protein